MPGYHYIVSLFGTSKMDGVRASIYMFDVMPATQAMMQISQNNHSPRESPIYVLRCFSKFRELDVPPLTSFAAVHVLVRENRVKATTIRIRENSSLTTYKISLQSTAASKGPERILLHDLFGIMKRGLELEYIEASQTLIVYDNHSTKEDLARMAPRSTNSTNDALEKQKIQTIVVCVEDPTTGGIHARAFFPGTKYTEANMPVLATPYLGSQWTRKATANFVEISWSMLDRHCHIIKQTAPDKSIALMTKTITLQASNA
ncbi:hypothetical protein DL89DRAFT_325318 [Linderina pennispora]|uniref:Uncharacterized protein n=1 Tax=Linderina pennispora TaxID=61395 RepID=A0A1Y1VXB9_9FUNG|nr:uncharacterized protein DL89DRAFT_325318 [Linderina pennispora]ORX65922.1 hypothetical protein DL89DRAFT_325318 [Linderina pennispora]